jgi:hypothetical protein
MPVLKNIEIERQQDGRFSHVQVHAGFLFLSSNFCVLMKKKEDVIVNNNRTEYYDSTLQMCTCNATLLLASSLLLPCLVNVYLDR